MFVYSIAKMHNHWRIVPGEAHNHARRTVDILTKASSPSATDDDRRRGDAALCSVGPGTHASNVGRIVAGAKQQGALDHISHLGVFEALPAERESAPDRRVDPTAVDNVGMGERLASVIRDQPVDIIDDDGSFGLGGTTATRATERLFREGLVGAARTVGGLRRLIEFKHGLPTGLSGQDLGQKRAVAGNIAILVKRNGDNTISDGWPQIRDELIRRNIDVDDESTKLDASLVLELIGHLTLIFKNFSVESRELSTDASVSVASLAGEAAAAERARNVESMTSGVGGRVVDERAYTKYNASCFDNFDALFADNVERANQRLPEVMRSI